MSAATNWARLIALPFALVWSACLGVFVLIRTVLAAADRAIDTTLRRIFTPSAPVEPIHPLDELARMLWKSRLTSQQVDRIIAAFPEIKRPLFPAVSADLSQCGALQTGRLLDKGEAAIDRYLAQNRGQEFVIRKALFAATLDRKLRCVGTSLEEMIDQAFIPAGIERALTESVDETLYRVFDLPPKGPGGLERFSLAVHLPVFIYNAMRLITEFVPTGGLRLLSVESRAKMLTGDFSPISREILGTAMFVSIFVWLTS